MPVCAFMSVSFRLVPPVVAKTSAIDRASARSDAYEPPPAENEKLEFTDCASASILLIVFVDGSSLNRCEYVRSAAEKNKPSPFHATIDGSSSKSELKTVGVPPAAGTVAMTRFAYMKVGLAMD